MADDRKKKKKPRHTNLVLPTDKKKDDKRPHDLPQEDMRARVMRAEGEPQAEEAAPAGEASIRPAAPAAPTRAAAPPPQPQDAPEDDPLPPNAIRMPKRRKTKKRIDPKLTPGKRRRRRRRLQALAVLVLALVVWWVYSSGLYMSAATRLGDWYDGIKIAARPGEGFPMDFTVVGFVKAESMGANGFAALGNKELAIVSNTGAALRRVQHSYLSPGASAGDTRVVVYNRGGTEYTVEGRSKTLAQRTTSKNIQFCEMSPAGWLAVVTSSRFLSELVVYDPTYNTADPQLTWEIVDEKPILAAFHSDDRNMVLGCVSAKNGAMGSTLYMLRTDRSDLQGQVREEDAVLLHAQYTSGGKIVAVFDGFAALYNTQGTQLARFDFAGQGLLALDVAEARVALVFGSQTQDTATLLVLNEEMQPLLQKSFENRTTPKVMTSKAGTWVLTGHEVLSWAASGKAGATIAVESRPFTLVRGGEPLALVNGKAMPVAPLLQDLAETGTTGLEDVKDRGDGSASAPDSAPESAISDSTSGSASEDISGSMLESAPETSE